MPQIGWFELILIIVIAILIIGPKDFPVVLHKIGSSIKSIKKYFSELQVNVDQLTKIDDKPENLSYKKEKTKKDTVDDKK